MGSEAPKGFSDLIEEQLDALDISLRELARRAHISVSFLSRILAGERGLPDDEVLLVIAEALEIDPPELLLVEAGRVPQKGSLVKLLRAASELTASDLNQVNRVAADLLKKRRQKGGQG